MRISWIITKKHLKAFGICTSKFMQNTTLQQLCERISQQFSVTAVPAHIISNRRWEFIGDIGRTELPVAPPYRIKLSDTQGIVIYNWHALSPEQQKECESAALAVKAEL